VKSDLAVLGEFGFQLAAFGHEAAVLGYEFAGVGYLAGQVAGGLFGLLLQGLLFEDTHDGTREGDWAAHGETPVFPIGSGSPGREEGGAG